jgi:hypothetical protein
MDRTTLFGIGSRRLIRTSTALALAVASLAWAPARATAEAPGVPAADAPVDASSKFLRYASDDATGPRLQTSVVTYRNKAGQTVDLIGAVHIADKAYFDALNESFKGYEVVLYEMVKPRDVKDPSKRPAKGTSRAGQLNFVHTLQRFMQTNLELDFQLDRIDYSAKNFVHADLDSEEFLQMQQQRGESMLTIMLETMMKEMQNPSTPSADAPGIMDLITAMQAPDRARQLKIVMARQFGDMDRAMGAMEGSVIIDERNHRALKVLKDQLDEGKNHIGIFYGAGHFSSMEKQLIDLMGFEQVGEPRWITAWDLKDETPSLTAQDRLSMIASDAAIEPATKPSR